MAICAHGLVRGNERARRRLFGSPCPVSGHQVWACATAVLLWTSACGSGSAGSSAGGGVGGLSGSGGGGGAFGSGGSSSTPAPHVITCEDFGVSTVGRVACACTGDSNTGNTEYAGSACQDETTAHKLCCAAPSYPSNGKCSCYLTGDWFCTSVGSQACNCGFAVNTANGVPGQPGPCDNVPASDGVPWHCCASTSGASFCQCSEGSGTCLSSERSVTSCTTATDAGYADAPTTCPSGTVEVSACSTGATQSSGSGGSGGSGGSCDPSTCDSTQCAGSYCCSYFCSGGSCVQHCSG